jgi:hypothetical protein
VLAGAGGAFLWERRLTAARIMLVVLVVWLGAESLRTGLDPMSYFNEFGGSDPSRILVTGCDLDCGQDVARLGSELRKRKIEAVHIALSTSADVGQMNLTQKVETLPPNQRVSGWVAVSMRALRLGDVQHTDYPPGALSWLESYKPVTEVGGTIRLYCVPAADAASQPSCAQ